MECVENKRGRAQVTLVDAINMQFASIESLVQNLFVTNRNFVSGHYVTKIPKTADFIRQVLPLWHEGIVDRVEQTRVVVEENIQAYDASLVILESIEGRLSKISADQLSALGLDSVLNDVRLALGMGAE